MQLFPRSIKGVIQGETLPALSVGGPFGKGLGLAVQYWIGALLLDHTFYKAYRYFPRDQTSGLKIGVCFCKVEHAAYEVETARPHTT